MSTATAITDIMARPRFVSASGRTVGHLDHPGMEKLAEEHEWMRDRIARLELDNANLRSLVAAVTTPAQGDLSTPR